MQDEERHRLVAWLAAEFEVQNGIDVSRDTNVIARLQQTAEHAAAASDKYEVNLPFLALDETGPKHFHVTSEPPKSDSSAVWIVIAIFVLIGVATSAFVYAGLLHQHHDDHDGHGQEHKH